MARRNRLPLILLVLIVAVTAVVLLRGVPNWSPGDGTDDDREITSDHGASAVGGDEGGASTKIDEAERRRREAHEEELDRLRAASHEEAMRRMGAVPAAGAAPVIISVNSEGMITTAVIDALDLTPVEVSALKEAIEDQKEAEAIDFVSRASLTSETQGEFGTSYQYYVRAKKDRGEGARQALEERVEAVVGEDRARKFIGGMDEFGFLGGGGKYDIEFTFFPNEQGEMLVNYNYRDPASAKITRTRQTTAETLQKEFGDVFELPED